MKKRNQASSTISQPPLTATTDKRTLMYSLLFFCSMFAFLLYSNTLQHEFVLDDDMAIVKNTFVHDGISSLDEIFSTPYRAGFSDRIEGLYRPLSIALFAVQWELAPGNPLAGHLTNVLLYSLTACLLFVFLSLCFENKNPILPFATTLLFVAHPVHTEVVANIKSADEILCFLFSILTMWSALKYGRLRQNKYLVLAGISAFLAMLSKETGVTLLLMAPLTVYFFSNTGLKGTFISGLPVLISFIAYMVIRIDVLSGVSNLNEILLINNSLAAAGDNMVSRIATAVAIIGKYLLLLLIPYPLSFDYSYNTIPLLSPGDFKVLVSMAIIITLGVIAVRGSKTRNPYAWAIILFGAAISPVSNIFFLIEATMGERFLYLPSLGFCLMATLFFSRIFKVQRSLYKYDGIKGFFIANRGMMVVVLLIVMIYGAITLGRNTVWKDNLSLVMADVQTHPNSVRIRYAYGSILIMEEGLHEKDALRKKQLMIDGTTQLAEAVKILPEYGDAWFNLGMGYKELEEYKKAITCFVNAKEHMLKPGITLFVASGIAYGEDGQYEKAISEFKEALRLDSTSTDALNNIGLYYSRIGNYTLSIEMLQKAIALDPEDDHPYYNMGNTYAAMDAFDKAIQYYRQAIQLNPQSDIAWVNLGNSYGVLKDYSSAIKSFEEALKINPANENARFNTGTTYLILGDTLTAKKYLPAY